MLSVNVLSLTVATATLSFNVLPLTLATAMLNVNVLPLKVATATISAYMLTLTFASATLSFNVLPLTLHVICYLLSVIFTAYKGEPRILSRSNSLVVSLHQKRWNSLNVDIHQ